MLTRVVKALVVTISALVAIVVLLYATGVKIGDEGGVPEAERRAIRDRQALEIEKHRQAQSHGITKPSPAKADGPSDHSRPDSAGTGRDFRGPRRDGDYRERANP